MPGIELPQEFFPQPGDRFWTPADWAWAGGLLDCLLPSLYCGVPVVARRFDKFDPEEAFAVMARFGVRNAFIPPTALRMLRAVPNPRGRHDIALRSVGSGGEALGAETFEWGKAALGVAINEFYGQTECNLVVGSCASIGLVRPGAIGKAIPGHTVAVIDAEGNPVKPGEIGQIAVKRPDPVMFLEYWGNPDATREKFIGDWMTTGDQGVIDDEGYFTFVGRDDDVITSAGYRIGPGEIEDCLIKHPAVALAAVIGKPDPVRTEIVKAFIVLKSGQTAIGRARRRHPGVRAHASVGARISARDRLHRRDADDDDRQGDPAIAAGEGVGALPLFLLRLLRGRLFLCASFFVFFFVTVFLLRRENRVPIVLVGLGHRLLALASAVARRLARRLRRRPRPWLALPPRPWLALHRQPWPALASAALAGAASAALAGAARLFLGSWGGCGFLGFAGHRLPDADRPALIRRAARWRQGLM